MLVVAFRYTLPVTPEPSSPHADIPSLPGDRMESLGAREWLMVTGAGMVEIFLVGAGTISRAAVGCVLEKQGVLPDAEKANVSEAVGPEAAGQFLRLATGLEMDAQGRPLLETFHRAYHRAVEAGHIGPYLQRLFQRGVWLHEKARQETDYFAYATRTEAVVRELIGKILGASHRLNVVIVGEATPLSALVQELLQAGGRRFSLVNISENLPADLAVPWGAVFETLREMPELPVTSDVLILFPSSRLEVNPEMIQRRMHRDGHRPLLVFDFGNHLGDLKRLKKLPNLYVYTRRDIEQVIQANRAE
ncbi:MAG: hypothetical protein D6681_15625, partial [Calditrichaeota bacterium]